jgi:hypothetical protein
MSTGSTQPFAASATATFAATTSTLSAPLGSGDTALVYNASAGIAFVSFGNGAAVATLTGVPIPPGATRLLYIGPVANFAAVILSTGTGNVYVTSGNGTAY